jgi:hypothetical protein
LVAPRARRDVDALLRPFVQAIGSEVILFKAALTCLRRSFVAGADTRRALRKATAAATAAADDDSGGGGDGGGGGGGAGGGDGEAFIDYSSNYDAERNGYCVLRSDLLMAFHDAGVSTISRQYLFVLV